MSNAQTAQNIYDSIDEHEYTQVNRIIGPEKSLRLVLENARTVAAIAQAHALERIANLLAFALSAQFGYEEPKPQRDYDEPVSVDSEVDEDPPF